LVTDHSHRITVKDRKSRYHRRIIRESAVSMKLGELAENRRNIVQGVWAILVPSNLATLVRRQR
jgi:hypothetical protein